MPPHSFNVYGDQFYPLSLPRPFCSLIDISLLHSPDEMQSIHKDLVMLIHVFSIPLVFICWQVLVVANINSFYLYQYILLQSHNHECIWHINAPPNNNVSDTCNYGYY